MPKVNESLGAARASRNDEFYTQFDDIQKEIDAYLQFDEYAFRDKTVLLPCDDPEWSNFTKFFAQKFESLGLKKLISTSYAPMSKPSDIPYQPTLFELESPSFDKSKTQTNGKIFTLTKDNSGDGVINVEDLEWTYLEGDGDFRSAEIRALRDEADIVITNPPFSLFREFLNWLVEAEKKFVILGNMNAVTYKEVFPLIMRNKLWIGATRAGVGSMWFLVPDNAPEKSGQKIENGQKFQTIGNSAWFTNMDHGRRHQYLQLMTEQENIKFNKVLNKTKYKKYDNYDAIEIPRVDAIPSDYKGVMGVPITFLSKYNPDQFEILGSDAFDDTPPTKRYQKKKKVVDGKEMKSNTGTMGCVIRTEEFGSGTFFDVGYPVQALYKRIFIRHLGVTK
jgi:hypothetical protein